MLEAWLSPHFQRPLKENDKVRALAEQLKNAGGVWPGIITLGVLDGRTYLIDGQHRKLAFAISKLEIGYTDVRIHHFTDMAEMGEEFVLLNSQLVRMQPDDILRGLEASYEPLALIRKRCPFVGYDQVRRDSSSPIVSMSMIIRSWYAGSRETPSIGGMSATAMAQSLTFHEAEELSGFLNEAFVAFGRDPEYYRLWSALNITMCIWMYKRLVLSQYSAKTPKITREQFRKRLMSLSADSDYLDYLVGRKLGDRDRSPCYQRIKGNFSKRLRSELGQDVKLPAPDWVHHALTSQLIARSK